MDEIEALVSRVLDTAMSVHIDVGPGLFETVYELLLANRLAKQGIHGERQLSLGAHIDGLDFPKAFAIDLLVDQRLLVEMKSIDRRAGSCATNVDLFEAYETTSWIVDQFWRNNAQRKFPSSCK